MFCLTWPFQTSCARSGAAATTASAKARQNAVVRPVIAVSSMRRRRLVAEGARFLQIGMPEVAERLGEHGRLLLGGGDVDDQLGGALHDLGDEVGEIDRIVVLQMGADEIVDLAVQAFGHGSLRFKAAGSVPRIAAPRLEIRRGAPTRRGGPVR